MLHKEFQYVLRLYPVPLSRNFSFTWQYWAVTAKRPEGFLSGRIQFLDYPFRKVPNVPCVKHGRPDPDMFRS